MPYFIRHLSVPYFIRHLSDMIPSIDQIENLATSLGLRIEYVPGRDDAMFRDSTIFMHLNRTAPPFRYSSSTSPLGQALIHELAHWLMASPRRGGVT